ncbi:MAG: STAS domain-containing protein [Actinomycetota bacterium]|nr:STAS domain-containing protein [Actinomycetota bacterium]
MQHISEHEAEVAYGVHVGDRVEIATRFTGTWATGFEVAAMGADGFRIRRVSDNTLLPIAFAHDEVRPEPPSPHLNAHRMSEHADVPRESAVDASVVVRFPAELDMQTVDAIAPAVMDQINRARGEVVLDLDGVQFLDTYGIRLLVQVRRCAWERDLPVRLHGGKPVVRALLDLLGVDPLFVPEQTPRQAQGSSSARWA